MAGLVLALILATATGRVPPAPPAPPLRRPGADPLQELSDRDRCRLLSGAAARANRRMPMARGNGIAATGLVVDCAGRTSETRFTVAGAYAANAEAVRKATAERGRQATCSGELTGPMARRGFRFTSRYTFADGRDLVIAHTCR